MKKKESDYYYDMEESLSVTFKNTRGTLNGDFHMHSKYELLLCLSDNMFCRTDSTYNRVGKNTLLLFNCTDIHYFGTENRNGGNKRYVLCFDPGLISRSRNSNVNLLDCFLCRPSENGHILQLSQEQCDTVRTIFDKLLSVSKADSHAYFGKDLMLQAMLEEMLITVNNYYREKYGIPCKPCSWDKPYIYDMLDYIHHNFAENLSLETLAKRYYTNKYSLCEVFRSAIGVTPSQYIISYRIQMAKKMLLDGKRVEYVCSQCGYSNQSHFSRIFKSKVGQSPKQYQLSKLNSLTGNDIK